MGPGLPADPVTAMSPKFCAVLGPGVAFEREGERRERERKA